MKVDSSTHIAVFTDLDGTLLNYHDYQFDAALPSIQRIKNLKIPLVFVSSKTFDEVRSLQESLKINWPCICENGSLIFISKECNIPLKHFSGHTEKGNDGIFYYSGQTRDEITNLLDDMHSTYGFRGFAQMSEIEISELTGLTVGQAAKANRRLASEPIVWLDSGKKLIQFTHKINEQKLHVVKGGRFYHIMGNVDKAQAVTAVKQAFEEFKGVKIHSIVLGDSENDLAMLRGAATPVVIPRVDGTIMQITGTVNPVFASQPGASGWNECINAFLDEMGF